MIKDRAQKEKVLRYVISKDWFPQLEVDVSSLMTIGDKVLNITDIDVMASIPDDFCGYRILIFDCKTGRRFSPIGRALWQKGLMSLVDAGRGICILGKTEIEADHRYTSAQLDINLLSETEFEDFANATSSRYNEKLGALVNINLWDRFFSIGSMFTTLIPAITFSKSLYWMAENEVEACRRALMLLLELKPELDPDKREHLAVVGDLCALFMRSLAIIVSKIFAQYLQPRYRDDLSNALLFLMYGGRASYRIRNILKQKILAAEGIEQVDTVLSLPEWDMFVQIVRQALDSPVELNRTPLIIREIAWSLLGGIQDREFAKQLSSRFPHGARFAVLGLDYVCKAAQLPPEFKTILTTELMAIQQPK
jgi:hypothetical protein